MPTTVQFLGPDSVKPKSKEKVPTKMKDTKMKDTKMKDTKMKKKKENPNEVKKQPKI